MGQKPETIDRAVLAQQKFEDAALGDARRSERLQRIVNALATSPEASFQKAMNDEAELEAVYRFPLC